MGWTVSIGDELVHVIDPITGSYFTEDGIPCEMFVYFLVAEDDYGNRFRSEGSWDNSAEADAEAVETRHEIEWHGLNPRTSHDWQAWFPCYGTPAYLEWQNGGGELAWERNADRQAVWSDFYRMASW